MGVFIGFLLSLFVLFQVKASDLSTVKLNQVYWNDSRVLYSSPRYSLSNVNWATYNASQRDGTKAFPGICGDGAMDLAQTGDIATFNFTGTSVTVNFLSRWNGLAEINVLVDGELWGSVNTSNSNAEPIPSQPFQLNCIGISSITKSDLTDGTHNVSVVVPSSDPQYGYVSLLQSFEYTETPSGFTSKEASVNTIVGASFIVLFVILGIVLFLWTFERRSKNSRNVDGSYTAHRKSQSGSAIPLFIISLDKESPPANPSLHDEKAILRTHLDHASKKVDLYHTSTIETLEPLGIASFMTPTDDSGGEPSRLAVIQRLLDQGVPGPEIATVIQRMQEEAGQTASPPMPSSPEANHEPTTPPPGYDNPQAGRNVQ
ncbi:hypothetical protein FRB94_003443 [Tulasnella sp. JGI-2019a]|nr:hypothetical protein FRB93_005307 [Tulasnella sp. JGI-2019a]KAG9002972.1 hypothetical protein FRB94_003443 [Tulasnella sp. JGI-2019a]KAG9032331.1 hypothetical protein FRB95_001584 [Tulasnella sp. JGI-2019a]